MVDSITELTPADAGCIAVSGSHGGLCAARFALATRPLLSIFNDAGRGKDAAGVAGLAFLQDHGLAACTVAHSSARIGDAKSTLHEGVISDKNALATGLGGEIGQTVLDLIQKISYKLTKYINIMNNVTVTTN